MSNYNFSTKVIKLIIWYLTDGQQCVQIGSAISQLLTNSVGVLQGSILGPLLFSLYYNDLPDVCAPTVNCQMICADDTVIYLYAKSKKQTAEELSAEMVNITNWLKKSCLHLTVSKTVCMFFQSLQIEIRTQMLQ